jgi:small subunit ribosomal protein S16
LSVRLRLTRVGAKKDPVWRVVVADQRSPRDGRVIETIGHYNAQTEPSTIVIDDERAREWIERGAQPTRVVRRLLRISEAAPAEPQEPAADAHPAAQPEEQAQATPAGEEAEQEPQAEAQASDAEANADEAGGAEG